MKKGIGTFIIILLLTLMAGLIWWGLNDGSFLPDRAQAPSPTPSMSAPSPSPESKPTDGELDLDYSWVEAYDGQLGLKFEYPQDWHVSPATSAMGETSIMSFSPADTPDTGGVPEDELKIAVVRVASDDDREFQADPDELESETEVVVDGITAVRRVISGMGGGSVSTYVETDQGTYIISAYPPTSELLAVYDQFLDRIDLDPELQVAIDSPRSGTAIRSPLTVVGEAPGTWFFEGELMVSLFTYSGEQLVAKPATSSEDWMTQEVIPFETELEFEQPEATLGYLKIDASNPSGQPQNEMSYYWPVKF